MDFGFSSDPFACVESFIHGNKIYITRELYWHGMENMDIVPMLKRTMPELVKDRRKVYADSAYPATISQLSIPQMHPSGEKMESLYIEGAVKGKGSVEEGINWLRSYELIVDPSCKNVIFELHNYKYKTDKQTGDIIPEIEDKNNHAIDALRYAYNEEIISTRGANVGIYKKKETKKRRVSPVWST
jgi:phage terminase large subunit